MLKTVVLLNIFCANSDTFISGFFNEYKVKKQHLFEMGKNHTDLKLINRDVINDLDLLETFVH